MNRLLAAVTALSLIAGAGLLTAPDAFAQATPATPAQKAEPAKKAEAKKRADEKKSKKAKEKTKTGQPKTEPKAEKK